MSGRFIPRYHRASRDDFPPPAPWPSTEGMCDKPIQRPTGPVLCSLPAGHQGDCDEHPPKKEAR